jgi:hypothetical protein
MRPPLLVNTALRGLRLRSAPVQRLFTLNAISRFNRFNSTSAVQTSESCLLPIKDKKPYYITTPIFYVNADPHVGHLYTLVLTDAIKRWQKFKGVTAQLCTGTDEHGIKIQQAAAVKGVEPEEFVKKGADMFKVCVTILKPARAWELWISVSGGMGGFRAPQTHASFVLESPGDCQIRSLQ